MARGATLRGWGPPWVRDSPEVILRTYAHFIPGAGKRIASRLEVMYG
jgi:hypothetical protein